MVALTLLVAWPATAIAQDKTGRVKVQTPWLAAPGYMWIGGIDGESRDEDHDKWIDVLAVDWGSGAKQPAGPGRGAGAVVITRKLDTSSPKLVEKIAKGATVPEMVLHTPAGGEEPTYQAFELDNVRITSYSISTAGNVPMESITFQFEKIDIKDGPVLKGKKIREN
jgi:type VI secretion system secreted protein Hcp